MSEVIAEAICRHRHSIEWEHGRTTVCHDCEVLAEVVERVAILPRRMHGKSYSTCPDCGADLMRVAMVEISYVFVVCDCRANGVTYDHLVEQLWHTACLQKASVAA